MKTQTNKLLHPIWMNLTGIMLSERSQTRRSTADPNRRNESLGQRLLGQSTKRHEKHAEKVLHPDLEDSHRGVYI